VRLNFAHHASLEPIRVDVLVAGTATLAGWLLFIRAGSDIAGVQLSHRAKRLYSRAVR
jgi:hypothetical protein